MWTSARKRTTPAVWTPTARVHDTALPQDMAKLRALFAKVPTPARVLVAVDQPATIGALPVTVARAMDIDIAHLPGLAMRRIADLHPGNVKTDEVLSRKTVAKLMRESDIRGISRHPRTWVRRSPRADAAGDLGLSFRPVRLLQGVRNCCTFAQCVRGELLVRPH